MQVIFGVDKIRKFHKAVVAIGVFDGVHRGHAKILRAAAAQARRIGGTAVALTFWPQPQGAGHIYSLRHRLKLIAECGISACIVIGFNKKFSRLSAHDFVKNILYKLVRPKYIYVGRNFNFGRSASGDTHTLELLSPIYGFGLKVFDVLRSGGRPVSSTHIRALIREGKLCAAQKLLDRPVSVLGSVIKGHARGAKLGFPTANIDPHHEVVPPPGIYAVILAVRGRLYRGVCSIGKNPTFTPVSKYTRIEVYIFGFHQDIYGEDCEIRFIKKLRNEKKFATPAQLTAQIQKDVVSAKHLFSRH